MNTKRRKSHLSHEEQQILSGFLIFCGIALVGALLILGGFLN